MSDVQRAVEIGRELLAIEEAIRQAQIAHGNHKAFIYESALFARLSDYRESLRDELRDMA